MAINQLFKLRIAINVSFFHRLAICKLLCTYFCVVLVKDVYDYFRAIVSTREKSLRAMELTKDALVLNAANYTVWQYRYNLLSKITYSINFAFICIGETF